MSIGKKRFIEMAVAAFISFIMFATSPDSAWADEHHCHWLYMVIGIVTGLFAIYKLYQIMKDDSTPPSR